MAVKNKYVIRSRISERKFRELVRYFTVDINAVQIAALTGLSWQTINKHLMAIRLRIATCCQRQASALQGQIEVDESYFGARRVKGRRGRGALGKTIVFGLLKRGDRGYAEIVPDCSAATLQSIIKGKASIDSVIHSDGWKGYNGLVDFGYKKLFRVHHGNHKFAKILLGMFRKEPLKLS